MNIWIGVFLMLLAYFLGCISPATIVARINGINIREEGSGNPGTTNVLRVLGKKQAVITLVIDVGKGVLAVFLGGLCAPIISYGCAVMVLAGHCWPFQFRFKGGKGVAACLGAIATVSPIIAGTALLGFIVVVAITKYVSLGSIIAALIVPAITLYVLPDFFWFSLVLAVVVIYKHRANIGRLVRGEESKLDLHKKEKKDE